jgi:hypothetical protein
MKEMKTLLLDQTRYEIVDAKSRENIDVLNSNLTDTKNNLKYFWYSGSYTSLLIADRCLTHCSNCFNHLFFYDSRKPLQSA